MEPQSRFRLYAAETREDRAMLSTTVDRVPAHTAHHINRRLEAETEASVRYYARHQSGIDRRLRELDEEWDIERAIQLSASTLAFTGTFLGAATDRRWLIVPALVTAFLFQHTLQGWCPPVPILRRLGFRTMREIDTERVALKALRGDFGQIGPDPRDHDTRAAHALLGARL
jgi:hypothetical protein